MTTELLSSSALIERLGWRYATKKFDSSKKIPADVWQALEHALISAPSSFGLQPWHFVVVQDEATRKILREHSWHQPQVTDASHLVVLASRTEVGANDVNDFLSVTATTRELDPSVLEQYRSIIMGFLAAMPGQAGTAEWSSRQVYIALGFLLCSAATLGIDACPLEGIDTAKYNEILGLPARGFTVKVACALGYRASDDAAATQKKVRFDKERVISRV